VALAGAKRPPQAFRCFEHFAGSSANALFAADSAFHAAIARATGNACFLRFTEFLDIRLVPSRYPYLRTGDARTCQRYARTINRDHEPIYNAIAPQDPAAARRAARRHMELSIKRHGRLKEAGRRLSDEARGG
jgi:GntR family transcriptional regulator, transcriptional repressor for pyruvate dehydrogenase complex